MATDVPTPVVDMAPPPASVDTMPPLTPPTTSAAAEGVTKPPVSPAAPHSSTLVKFVDESDGVATGV